MPSKSNSLRMKEWRAKYPDRNLKSRAKDREIREKNQQAVYDYLVGKSCTDCPENDPRVLQFDHVRGVKTASVADMVAKNAPLDRIFKEIEKCDIRCANCHQKKTFVDFGRLKNIKMVIPPRPMPICPVCAADVADALDEESFSEGC